jgi:hypothetical protein
MPSRTTPFYIDRNHPSSRATIETALNEKYWQPTRVPEPLLRKLLDFLEDKWGTRVVRRRDAFYCEGQLLQQPPQPIAWLNSPDTVAISLIDSTSGKRESIQIRIEEIQLPTMMRVERKTYQSLLLHLIRRSGGGVVRWFNKFYCASTGNVLAELISPESIRLFGTAGLFGVSKVVDLRSYTAIQVPWEKYVRLLDFLAQEKGEEAVRIGNSFYPKYMTEILQAALRSPATVDPVSAHLLGTKLLAELVSEEIVRLRDGITKRILDLALTRRVLRKHLYFCSSCQSFIRQPYRATVHETESGIHTLSYISSYLFVVPQTRKQSPLKGKPPFPEILNKFWGIEKGMLANTTRISRKESSTMSCIPSVGSAWRTIRTRDTPATTLLLAAEISVDGHIVTAEEKIETLRRLESEGNEPRVDQQLQAPTTQLSLGEIPEEIPSPAGNFRVESNPVRVRHTLRKRREIERALKSENISKLPELESV